MEGAGMKREKVGWKEVFLGQKSEVDPGEHDKKDWEELQRELERS